MAMNILNELGNFMIHFCVCVFPLPSHSFLAVLARSDKPSGGFLRDPTFQKLLYLDVAANVVADISEAWEEST